MLITKKMQYIKQIAIKMQYETFFLIPTHHLKVWKI